MPQFYPPTPEEQQRMHNIITAVLDQLYPRDKITLLNRDETYHLCNLVSEVTGHIQEYSNLVWSHFNHLNKPTVDPSHEVLLRKLERALNNRGLDINNLINSLNEGSK
ncbi:MAG: hypothetical protein WC444_06390 [Candidatus Paceibacterota bacterium]